MCMFIALTRALLGGSFFFYVLSEKYKNIFILGKAIDGLGHTNRIIQHTTRRKQ